MVRPRTRLLGAVLLSLGFLIGPAAAETPTVPVGGRSVVERFSNASPGRAPSAEGVIKQATTPIASAPNCNRSSH